MTGQTIVRGSVVLDCSPFDPEAVNAAIAAVRAAVEAQHGAGSWEAGHDPFGFARRVVVDNDDGSQDVEIVTSPANLLTWTFYPNGGPTE
jgi:hypothetical protein